MKKFILTILNFFLNIYNNIILLFGILVSKIILILNYKKLVIKLKPFWILIISILSKPTYSFSILEIFYKILRSIYWSSILFFYTILTYCFCFLFINFFAIQISTCNKAVLFFLIYFQFYLFLVSDDMFSNQFWDNEFDWNEDYHFFSEWEDEDEDLSSGTSSWEENLELSDVVDTFDELGDDQEQNELFLDYIEIPEPQSFIPQKRLIVDDLDLQDEFINDIYLFERWYNVSNQVLHIFYKNRLLNVSKKQKNKFKIFINNSTLLIENKFIVYLKFFNLNFAKNIFIYSQVDLKNFMLHKYIFNYYLSDNLILFFRLYRPIQQLKYNRINKKRVFGLKFKKKNLYRHYYKLTPNFWGGRSIDNLFYKIDYFSLINNERLTLNTISTNYNNYIFSNIIFENFSYNIIQNNNALFKTNLFDLICENFNYFNLFHSHIISFNFLKFNNSKIINLNKKDFLIYDETFFFKNYSSKIFLKTKKNYFNLDLFIIFSLIKKKIKLSPIQESRFFYSIIYNSEFWLKLEKFYNKKFFESLINIILTFLIKKFNKFNIKNRNIFSYLIDFISSFFENDLKLLLKSAFFVKYLRINFQKLLFKTIFDISINIYKNDIYEKGEDLFNSNLRFYFLFRLYFYKTILPEQNFYNSSLSFSFLYSQYKEKNISSFYLISASKPIQHLFLNIRSDSYRKYLAYNIEKINIKYNVTEIDLPTYRVSIIPEVKEPFMFLTFLEKYENTTIHVADIVLKWLETSYTSQYNYSFLFRRYYKIFYTQINKHINYSKFSKTDLILKNKFRFRKVIRSRSLLVLFDNFFYFFFYGFSYLLKSRLKYSYFIALKNNLRDYFSYLSFDNYYKYYYLNKSINIFLFPYIDYSTKIYKRAKIKNKNFYKIISEITKDFNDNICYKTFSSTFHLKLIKRLNLFNFNSIQFDFILILLLLNNSYTNLLRNKNITFLKESIININDLIFTNFFIRNLLNLNKIKYKKTLKINNFHDFRNSLIFYFSNNQFAFSYFFSQIYSVTFQLRYKDFAVLSNLSNHFWLYGSYHSIRDYDLLTADQNIEWFQDKVLLQEPFDLDLSVSAIDEDYTYKDDGALIEIVDGVIFSFSDDFYDQNESHFNHLISYIDTWLQKNYHFPSQFFDDESLYMAYFHSIFTLWVICRMQWMLWSNTDYDHDHNSIGLPYIIDLIDYEEFSDVYKNSNLIGEVTTFFSNDFGTTFQGKDRGIIEDNLWCSAGLGAPLEEDQMYEEFSFGGRVKNPTRYEDHEEFNQFRYFIEEQSYNMMDLEGFYPDFFRYRGRKNYERRVSTILKWNIFSELQYSLNLLRKPALHFLYLRNRRDPQFVKYRTPQHLGLYADPELIQKHTKQYFVKKKLNKYRLKPGFYKYLPRELRFDPIVELDTEYYNNTIYNNNKLIFDNNFRINYIIKNFLGILKHEDILFKEVYEDNPHNAKLIRKFINRINFYEKLIDINEKASDRILDLVQRVNESNSTIITPSYYKKNIKYRRFDFFANDYDEASYFFEDPIEMSARSIYNWLLGVQQTFLYRLRESKRKKTNYEIFIYNLFNSDILKPIYNNVTLYGTDLLDNYHDTIEILPIYYSFLENLSDYEKYNYIKKVPEFYKLLFDNLHFLINDPYLNTNQSSWYYNFYNNPWFIKNIIKKKYYHFRTEIIDMNTIDSAFAEYFLISNGYGRELEWGFSADLDLYTEVFAMLFNFYDPYETEPYDVVKLMVMKLEQIMFGLYGIYNPKLLYDLKKKNNSQEFHKITRTIMKRRPIRERMLVSIDWDQSFRVAGLIKDPIIRVPRWGGDNFRKTLFTLGRVFGSTGYFSTLNKNSFINQTFIDVNDYIHNMLNQDNDCENKNRSHYKYLPNNFFQSEKFNANINFRKFNNEAWHIYLHENIFNLATQYIENRYQFSDRLFSTHPNVNFDEAVDRNAASDFFSLETDTDATWFELEEISLPETVRPYGYEVKFWDNLVMSLLEYPHASPPALIFNWVTGNLEQYKPVVLYKYKIFPKTRQMDPIKDAEPFEGFAITLEDGEFTLKYILPVFTTIYDFFLKNVLKLLTTFKFLSKNTFLIQKFGTGNFNNRSNIFENALIRNRLQQASVIEGYNRAFKELNFLPVLNLNYKKVYYFLKYFLFIDLRQIPLLNDIILFIFNFIQKILNFGRYINLISNAPFLRDGFVFTTFIILFVLYNFLIFIPMAYIISLIRNWLYFPFEYDDDDLALEDFDQYYERNVESFTHPYTIKDNESDFSQTFQFAVSNLYSASQNNEELFFDPSIFYLNSSDNIMYFNSILHLSFKNELLFFLDINLPGYKFTYNIFDIFNYIDDVSYKIDYKGSLPFYKRFYIEYLHVLLGARIHSTELQTSFYEQSYFYYLYFFTTNKFRLNLHSNNTVNIEDLIFHKKKFKQKHKSTTNIESYKKKIFSKYELFNEIEEKNNLDYKIPFTNNNNLKKKFLKNKKKLKNKRKKNNFYEKLLPNASLQNTIKQNRVAFDYYKEVNIPLRTLWLNNKYIFNTLQILDFSFNILINNDYYTNLLYYETHAINNFIKLNILSVLCNNSSFFFLSKNGLVITQYQPGDNVCPIYLRFNRYIDNLNNSIDFNYNIPSDDLIYLYDSNWKFNSNFYTKLKNISMNDLNFIIPFNQDGITSFEVLFAYILNLKLFFSDAIIFDESKDYENLLLDFNNYELNKFYTRSFFSHFQDLEDFGEQFDYTDWLKLFEEQKEWSIFLENDRFITLDFMDESLVSFEERFDYNNELNLKRKIHPMFIVKRTLNKRRPKKKYKLFNWNWSAYRPRFIPRLLRPRTKIKGLRYKFLMDGAYRRLNHGISPNFRLHYKYGQTIKNFAKKQIPVIRLLKKKRNFLLQLQQLNITKKFRYQFLPLSVQFVKKQAPQIRSNFIYFDDPKYEIYHDIYYTYGYNLTEKVQFINQFQVPYNFTEYVVSYNDQDIRYLELFNFPSNDFRFSFIFNNIPNQNIFEYRSVISMFKLKTYKSDYKIISNKLFFDLITKQYINTSIHKDIYSILTPEGRAINKRLTNLSSLQMYSYTNYHLNLRIYKNLNRSFNEFYFNLNYITRNKINFNFVFRKIINIMLFIGLLISIVCFYWL